MNEIIAATNLNSLLFVVIAIVVAVMLLRVTFNGPKDAVESKTWPFYAKKLLSVPEQVLYFRIVKALPDHLVFAQVGLSRILGVKRGYPFQTWHNKIDRKSADFVICSKDSSIVAVIELDDSTHERADRKHADATKQKALSSASIRLIRWNVKSLPDEASIKAAFHA